MSRARVNGEMSFLPAPPFVPLEGPAWVPVLSGTQQEIPAHDTSPATPPARRAAAVSSPAPNRTAYRSLPCPRQTRATSTAQAIPLAGDLLAGKLARIAECLVFDLIPRYRISSHRFARSDLVAVIAAWFCPPKLGTELNLRAPL
jgi:hypothetical protein